MSSSEVRYQFGPPVRPVFMAGIRYLQAGILVVFLGGAVLFIRMLPNQLGFGGALACVTLAVVAAFGSIAGRPVDDWLAVSLRWALTVARKRRRWTSPVPTYGDIVTLDIAKAVEAEDFNADVPNPNGHAETPLPAASGESTANKGHGSGRPSLAWWGKVGKIWGRGRSQVVDADGLSSEKLGVADKQPSNTTKEQTRPKRPWRRRAEGKKANSQVSIARMKASKPSPPPPVHHHQIIHASIAGQSIGVLHDRRAKVWSAAIGVQGQSFLLLDENEKVRRMTSWAVIQASMARHGSPISRLQWLERTLTEIGDEMRTWFEVNQHHPASPRAGGTDDGRQASVGPGESYEELLSAAQPVTQQHQTYVVVQISATKASKAIRQGGGGNKGAIAVLYRELTHLERSLRDADLRSTGVLGGDEIAGLVRTQFEPESALGLASKQTNSGAIHTTPRNAWPLATDVSWGTYRTDGTHHITFWVADWPRVGVQPSFLAPLLLASTGVARTVSLVSEPVPMVEAIRRVEHEQTARISDDAIRQGAGYRSGARRQREAEALDRRENELADGHAEFRFSGYVTVSGRDLDEVEAAAANLEQVAYQCPIELRRLWGEQESAFYTSLPLARGLG